MKNVTCRAPGCERRPHARGLCGAHNYRWERFGSFSLPEQAPRICSVEGCGRPHCAKGFCRPCYHKKYPWHPSASHKEKKRKHERAVYRNESVEQREHRKALNREWRNRKLGFSERLVDALFQNQRGLCAICSVPLVRGSLKPNGLRRDHCHETGEARGLLCGVCNTTLGLYEKHQRPAGLRIEPYDKYLAEWSEQHLIFAI